MNYLTIVQWILQILFGLFGLLTVHYLVFAVTGLLHRKTYPKTEAVHKYGMIIPARNEESVVAGLIESIQKNRYPQDQLQIFVIAHNCTDRTAAVARQAGATVYEYNNPDECTMGYAFRYLFSCIERDYGTQSFDGFFLFNADNILDKDYIARMNDAFEYYRGQCVITSFRNSKNFGSNLISGLYGMYFAVGCRMESRGRTVTGCSTRVQGTGYLINSDVVKNGWPYVTLTEDWEFTADQILAGNVIRYCDDAVFYDEQPVSFRIMWRQRVRWSRGHLLVFFIRIKDLFLGLFRKGNVHRVSTYDIMVNTMPIPLMFLALYLLQIVLLLIAPLVDPTLTLRQIFLGRSTDVLLSDGALFEWLRSLISSYVTLVISAILIFVLERRRIKKVSWWHKILICLLWPLFILIQIPMDVQAVFSPRLGWKPIPHSDTTTFDHVNPAQDAPHERKPRKKEVVRL